MNFIKRDFFLNPATPSFGGEGEAHYQLSYHRHDYMEFIFVLRGSYVQSINGVLHRHQAGDVCMLNPNVIHRDEVSGPEDRVLFMGLSAGFLKGELARFLPRIRRSRRLWRISSGARISSIFCSTGRIFPRWRGFWNRLWRKMNESCPDIIW